MKRKQHTKLSLIETTLKIARILDYRKLDVGVSINKENNFEKMRYFS